MAVSYVDVSDIHLRDIQFRVTREDGREFDFSDVVTEFDWTDHVNTAGAEVTISCRGSVSDILSIGNEGSTCKITAPLVDLDTGKLVRRELWQGVFEEIVDNRTDGEMERSIVGYDIGYMLAQNEEDYVFTNSTLSAIVNKMCSDFSIPKGTIATTTKNLGQVIGRGVSMWDLLQEATQRHADRTGEVYRIYAANGRIHMKLQGDQTRYWVFEAGESLQRARRTRSLKDLANQYKIYGVFEGETDKPKVEATKKNTTSQSLYGLRQRVEYVGSADNEATVVDVAKKSLDRFSVPSDTIDLTGWLVPNLRAGEQIRFIDTEWGLNRLYYVESIDTTWSLERAETFATVRRDAIDPELILSEVTSA